MKKGLLMKGAYLLLSIFASCSSDIEGIIPPTSSEEVNKVIVNLPKTEISSESRVHINIGNSVDYIWESTDILGIFPEQGYQVAFPLNASSNSNSATFEGGGWGLLANTKYAAYYPFDYDNKRNDSIPITYLGQKQVGNANTNYADNYNFMAAHGSKPSGGTLNFIMQRLGRLIILKFNVPEPTTLTSVKLMAPEKVFITKGYFNLWDETLSIKSTEMSYALNIDLENITTTTPDEEVTVYFFMAPVNLSGKTLTIETTDHKGNKTLSTVTGKDMTASRAYALTGNSVTEVEVAEAGTLSNYIPEDKKYTITTLKITGTLNGEDILFIREMLGRDIDGNITNGKLHYLDLSQASITSGGIYYKSTSKEYLAEANKIGISMFRQCDNLIHINLPQNITSIEGSAFYECTNLANIKVASSVKSIGDFAFYCCSKLESVNLPYKMDEIGIWAFTSCSNLRNFTLPKGIKAIGKATFSGCTNLAHVNLPNTITTIGESAFKNCKNLKDIQMPDAITTIEKEAFYACSSLASIKLPDSHLSIKEYAFYKTNLSSVTLWENIQYIGFYAFADNTNLSTIYCYADTPPNIAHFYSNNGYIQSLFVPKRCLEAYFNNTNWSSIFHDIKELKE